ncbi:MAG: hypothetical protein HUJ97_04325 [Bacteroidales bacterium]|nr:hypothetical protein [Bacteroidales bacterium]
MAKQEKEFTVTEKLANLYKLQLYVSEIDSIKSLRGELPQEVEDMENEIAKMEEKTQKHANDLKDANARIANCHAKIAEAEALISQYNSQIDEVQNNKQYDFLTKEIEYQSLEIELANKRINENNAMIEEIKAKMTSVLEVIDEKRADLDHKKGELDEIIAETRSAEETLRDKAKKIENSVDLKLLATFRRIHKKAKNGLAIVAIERDSCGGCFNKITPQRIIDVRTRKRILTCEYCGRILIDEELANENEMRRRRKGILSQLV